MSGIFDQVINYAPPSLLLGTVTYKGTWSAATNTPTLLDPPSSITNGNYYVVSAAGTQFSLSFNIGDWIISNGSAWEKVDNTDAVSSVFGRMGAVVGVSTDYSAVGITNTALGASNPSTVAATTVTATSTIAATGAVTGSNLSGTNTGDQTITLTGGVTGSGTGSFAATVVTNANLTGVITSSGNATSIASQTGTGTKFVVDTSPVLVTPNIGIATGTSLAAALNGTLGATTPSTIAATTGVFNSNTSALPAGPATTVLQVGGADSTNPRFTVDSFAGISVLSGRRANTSNAAKSAILSGDQIMSVSAFGYKATGYSTGAGGFINWSAAENWTDTAIGTNSSITLVPNGSLAQTVSFNFANTGIFSISGGATPGINSTAIGNVTPSTGAFTTLSATGQLSNITTSTALFQNGNGVGLLLGADNSASTLTNATTKVARFAMPHYTNAEESFTLLNNSSQSTTNVIAIGGGSGVLNSATQVTIYAAANNTTLFGTQIASYTVSGLEITGTLSATGNSFIGASQAFSTTAGRAYLQINGSSLTGVLQLGTKQADADGNLCGLIEAHDINSTSGSTRVGYMAYRLAGATANNRGSTLSIFTKPNGSTGLEMAVFSSTGLAVTGALSASTSLTVAGSGTVDGNIYTKSDGTTYGQFIGSGYIMAAQVGASVALLNRNGSDGTIVNFYRSGTTVGTISVTTTATAYNTSSDYRLKNVDGPVVDSGTFIDALKPKAGTWKADGSKFVGFLAHEFAEVSPLSVSGEKDAVDADGKPVYQSMQASTSEVIANLVAELQSLRKRLAALESK